MIINDHHTNYCFPIVNKTWFLGVNLDYAMRFDYYITVLTTSLCCLFQLAIKAGCALAAAGIELSLLFMYAMALVSEVAILVFE